MDYLTAYRTFGNSKYSPAKGKMRIHKDKWYHVTFQNTSRDQGDGYYLEEGEYVELLPGDEARRARDAHLNHCNAIAEYNGAVYAVYMSGSEWRWPFVRRYAATLSEAETMAESMNSQMRDECHKSLVAIDSELSMTDEQLLVKYGNCKDWPEHPEREMERWREFYRKNKLDCLCRLATPATIETVREPRIKASSFTSESAVSVEYVRDWTWIKFSTKPSEEVIQHLRELDGKYSVRREAWYITQHVEQSTLGL